MLFFANLKTLVRTILDDIQALYLCKEEVRMTLEALYLAQVLFLKRNRFLKRSKVYFGSTFAGLFIKNSLWFF